MLGVGQDPAERVDRRGRRRAERDLARGVERDEVHLAAPPLEQPHQLAGVLGPVVHAAQQHVFVRDPAAARDRIALRRRDHVRQRVLRLDRHQLAAQGGVGRVQADRQVRAHRLLHQLLQRGQDADRGERQLLRRDREAFGVHEHAQGLHGRVVVEQRLAHPHHHDVPALLARRRLRHDRGHLAQDLVHLEVALVAGDAGQAERALERAAGLGGDADGAPRRLRDVDALDGGAVLQAEEVLDRTVEGLAALGHLGPAQRMLRVDLRARGLRQVRHLVDGADPLAVEPAVELVAAVCGLSQRGRDRRQRLAREPEEVGPLTGHCPRPIEWRS